MSIPPAALAVFLALGCAPATAPPEASGQRELPVTTAPVVGAASWTTLGSQGYGQLGAVAAGLGDINGDGYGDLALGAPGWDGPLNDAGAVFVWAGSASGPASTATWTHFGEQASHRLGEAVAPAGDVDGDGYDDLLVGEPSWDGALGDSGRARLFLGGPLGLGSLAAWAHVGTQLDAHTGGAVASAGDVNADGRADVLVGSPWWDGAGIDEGRVELFLGTAAGLASSPAWASSGAAGSTFGSALAGVGDIDGDGRGDIVIGAPRWSGSAAQDGAAFLYRGSGPALSALPGWSTGGAHAGARHGGAVAALADTDGDGLADFVVGSGDVTGPAGSAEGLVEVWAGTGSGVPVLRRTWHCGQAGARCGERVSGPGDVDGDGYADVLVAGGQYDDAPLVSNGHVFLLAGGPSGPGTAPAWDIAGPASQTELGLGLGSAVDINGDGLGDVLVGAGFHDGVGVNSGAAWIHLGTPALPGGSGATVDGESPGERLGATLAPAGDIDGDGFDDLLVGAPGWDGSGNDAGRVALRIGGPAGLGALSWFAAGAQAGDALGAALAGGGDVDGDGFDDVVVGAPGEDTTSLDGGTVRLFLGSASGLNSLAAWSRDGLLPGAALGAALSLGDCDGEGHADLLVGAPGWDGLAPAAGAAWVHLGGPAGLPAAPLWSEEGSVDGGGFGAATAMVDGDGDGDSDLVIGAPGPAASPNATGAVHTFLCGPLGVEGPGPDLALTQPGARFGAALASAGDIDGDGFEDLLIAAPAWDTTFADAGSVWLWRGSLSGLLTTPDWSAQGDSAGMAWGRAITSGGDADGDGLADVLVGSGALGAGLVGLYVGHADGHLVPRHFVGGTQSGDGFGDAVAALDSDGDGRSDTVVGAPLQDAAGLDSGRIVSWRGAASSVGAVPAAPHLLDAGQPVAVGARAQGPVEVVATARGPWGRGQAALELEIESLPEPWDGADTTLSPFADTGTTGVAVQVAAGPLPPEDRVHLRARLRFSGASPWGHRRGPWLPLGRPGLDALGTLRGPCLGDLDLDRHCDAEDPDADGDGALAALDCDDQDPQRSPGAAEFCDLFDSDCDGDLVDGEPDLDLDLVPDCVDDDDDGDGSADQEDCAPQDGDTFPNAVESCDLLDADCDGELTDGFADTDGDLLPDCVDDDDDADGAPDGTDCAPQDAQVFPGAVEICDAVDSDCDGDLAEGEPDWDGDLLPDCADPDDDGDLWPDGDDCAPLDPSIFPGAPELCDLVDSDCDGGFVDEDPDLDQEGVPDCADADDDGDGVIDELDCAPDNPSVRPGLPEICDELDQDCDGEIDEGVADWDADGLGDCTDDDDDGDGTPDVLDCGPFDPTIRPGAPDPCDAIDQDCDGDLVEGGQDLDQDLVPDCVDEDDDGDGTDDDLDCGPSDAAVHPGAAEFCDGEDQDCDLEFDEGFPDLDGDTVADCTDDDDDGDGTLDGDDCGPWDEALHPGAAESCDAVDQDCDGDLLDGGPDLDGDGVPECGDEDGDGDPDVVDCAPLDPSVHAGQPELCNGVDDDCSGTIETASELPFREWYADSDGDGLGDPGQPWPQNPACARPPGHVANGEDCADDDALLPAGPTEEGPTACTDGRDQDCDGAVDLADDDCKLAFDLEPPMGCGVGCGGGGAAASTGLLLPLATLLEPWRRRRRREGPMPGHCPVVLLLGLLVPPSSARAAPAASDPRTPVVMAVQPEHAKAQLRRARAWDEGLDVRPFPGVATYAGAWLLGAPLGSPCAGGPLELPELERAVTTARARVDALETRGAADVLAAVRSRMGCLAAPAPGENLWAVHFLEAVVRSYEYGAAAAVPALERALAMRPGAGFDPSYPPEIGGYFAAAQEKVLRGGRGVVMAVASGPEGVGAAWVDGLLVPAEGLSVAMGEHLLQIRSADGRLRGGSVTLKDGDLIIVGDPLRVVPALAALDRQRQRQIARWLLRVAAIPDERRLWLLDAQGAFVRLAETTAAARPRPTGPQVGIQVSGGYQRADAWHWATLGLDLAITLKGPLRVHAFARPSLGARWENPADGGALVPVAVPWGVGVELRAPGKVAPFLAIGFSAAFDRVGAEAHRVFGDRVEAPAVAFLPGVLGGGGLLAGPEEGPVRFLLRGEGGVLGTEPVGRFLVGVQVGK